MRFQAQCFDRFSAQFLDAEGKTILEHRGYVPYDMGIGGGDEIELTVDVETGRIVSWDQAQFLGAYKDLTFERG
jgi:hypothetical protein